MVLSLSFPRVTSDFFQKLLVSPNKPTLVLNYYVCEDARSLPTPVPVTGNNKRFHVRRSARSEVTSLAIRLKSLP